MAGAGAAGLAGGAEVYTHECARRWVAWGHSVTQVSAAVAGTVLLVAAALGRDMLMAAPGTWEVLRFCFSGGGRTSLADGVAVVSAWCLTLPILVFNAFFGLLLPDGNLLLRGVGTLILSAALLWLYARVKRSVLSRSTA